MAVLKTKNETELIVSCKCGCEDGIHLRVDKDNDDWYAIMTYINGNFYRDQSNIFCTLKNKIRKIWAIIRNKDYYYSDVNMSKKEYQEFKDYINKF